MSDHSEKKSVKEYFDYQGFGGKLLFTVALAIVALGLAVWGGMTYSKQFAFSWLFAFAFFFTICAGSLFWILVHHAVDADWSVAVRRQLENVAWLFPIIALLFIPIILNAPTLFKWMKIAPGVDPLLDGKAAYLNQPFFWTRAAFYLGFFSIAAFLLRRNSVRQDKDGDARYTWSSRKMVFGMIPLFALSLTFGAFDWLMGLDFHWFSTMWGVYIFAGSALSSMCVLVLLVTALRSAGYLEGIVSIEHYHIMGKLMLAFTVFWAYIGFSQYMLIWYANIPEETIYFLRRNTGSWNTLNIIMVIGHFFLPFVVLLFQGTKKRPALLCAVAVWILLMHMLDMYIIVLPTYHKAGSSPHWLDLVCVLAIGATLAAVFMKRLGDTPLWPLRDPRLKRSINLRN
ncbi:MAG: hypothetical protein ACKO39_07370 [Chthoniobacterales bacterium]